MGAADLEWMMFDWFRDFVRREATLGGHLPASRWEMAGVAVLTVLVAMCVVGGALAIAGALLWAAWHWPVIGVPVIVILMVAGWIGLTA